MDISDTLAPNSDQLDAVDLIGNPRTFTVTEVTKGNAEQPVQVHLAEFPRVWRPGKSMRRVLASCWGKEADAWVGRRLTLYCDERVKFGSEVVGGTRISHLSHIDKARTVPLIVARGKGGAYTVEPLPDDAPTSPPLTETDVRRAALQTEWHTATPERRAEIEAEAAALDGGQGEYANPETPEPDGRDS